MRWDEWRRHCWQERQTQLDEETRPDHPPSMSGSSFCHVIHASTIGESGAAYTPPIYYS